MGSAKGISELKKLLTSSNTIDSTQFSDTEPKVKVGQIKP